MPSQFIILVVKQVNSCQCCNTCPVLVLTGDLCLGWNSCSLNNCSQLCLTGMSDRSCSCSYGVLDADGLTCKSKDTLSLLLMYWE